MAHLKFAYGSAVLAAAALLMLASGSTAFSGPPDHAKNPPPHTQGKKAPIVLESHGQFWAGGEIVTRSYPVGTTNLTSVNQAYVEYVIPQKKRKKPHRLQSTMMAGQRETRQLLPRVDWQIISAGLCHRS